MVDIHSAMNIQLAKQIGGGGQWVELSTGGMGEPTYGLSVLPHLGGVSRRFGSMVLSPDIWVCTVVTFLYDRDTWNIM